MKRMVLNIVAITLIAILLAGCASGDGGAVVGGILQGGGAGLSGL